MKNLIELINNFIKKLLDYLLLRGEFRLSNIDLHHFIIDSTNIVEVQTHSWSKKYIDSYNINDAENVFCIICNIKISNALYCEEEESLTCEEQQIKKLLE